jgi:PLP dependent protein
MGDLSLRIAEIRDRISGSAARRGRLSEEILLVAVSKTQPLSLMREALSLGVSCFGENKVQEAESKITEIGREGVMWHMIGHLQENKARRAVKLFDMIHSVDSQKLALKLERLCEEERREELPVLIQVDLGGEETKSGVGEAEVARLAEQVAGLKRLSLRGLMTLPPFMEDLEKVRPYFSRLRQLRDDLKLKGFFGESKGELSMGMSHDFEIAIEEGATMVRVGTALFGPRS